MATRCSYCGNELPQGNARFCNHCGMLIPSHVSNQQAQATSNSDSNNNPMNSNNSDQYSNSTSPDSWSALQRREQPENKPPASPQQMSSQDLSPDQSTGQASMRQGATPWLGLQPNNITPWLGLSSDDRAPQGRPDQQREASDALPQDNVRRSPARSANVVPQRPVNNEVGRGGVADPDQLSAAKGSAEDADSRQGGSGRSGSPVSNTETEREPDIDEISTVQMHSADLKNGVAATVSQRSESQDRGDSASSSGVREQRLSSSPRSRSSAPDIEDMPTIATARSQFPLASQDSLMPQTPPVAPQTPATPVPRHTSRVEEVLAAVRLSGSQRNLLAAVVAAGVVLVLIVVGIFFIVTHSNVDINPLQTMNNSTLGVSMSYPSGWHEVNAQSSLTLTDSSNTAQMKIARTGTSDAGLAIQHIAAQIGMTDGKAGSSVTFGNCTWQQMSGNFQIQGADYHGTIYACQHNNQTYTLLQMSPKSTYADEETIVFAPARASLKLK